MLSTSLDLFGLFALLSAFFCLVILGVFAVHNSWSVIPNRLLFCGIAILALAAVDAFVTFQGTILSSQMAGVLHTVTFLVMPVFFLFVQRSHDPTWRHLDFLHFIPAGVYLTFSLWSILSLKTSDSLSATAMAEESSDYFYIIRMLLWIGYSIATLRIIYQPRIARVGNTPSWLKPVVIFLAATGIVPPASRLMGADSDLVWFYSFLMLTAFVLSLLLLINPAVLYGISVGPASSTVPQEESQPQPVEEKTSGTTGDVAETDPAGIEQLRPRRISLSEEQIEYMHKKLHEFMFIRKPFLHQKYTLQQLSSDSGFPLYQLSLYLNRTLGMNFNSYINKMRIEFLLESYKRNQEKWNRYTLEAIAREIGFNNRTSFIQAFKKVTGTNPSVYFKNIHGHILRDQ